MRSYFIRWQGQTLAYHLTEDQRLRAMHALHVAGYTDATAWVVIS